MGWFSSKDSKPEINQPKDMSPLEAVTHLCASIQLADGQADYEERQTWIKAIEELFPEFSEERADRFLLNPLYNESGVHLPKYYSLNI